MRTIGRYVLALVAVVGFAVIVFKGTGLSQQELRNIHKGTLLLSVYHPANNMYIHSN